MKQKKHILRKVILTIAPMTTMAAALLIGFRNNNAVSVEALSGSGTENDPFLISSSEDLREVMSNVDTSNDYAGKYLLVKKDLSVELSATTNAKTFRGHLDGGGFTITLSTSATTGAVSMFNCVGSVGSVSNIAFEGSLSGVGSMSSTVCVYNYGSISNVTNNCDINSTAENGIIGGIAASEIATTANIENCVNNATISGTTYVGGIVGNLRVGSISDSTNNGEVISSSTNSGGIVGGQVANSANNATITNCTNNSSIHGTQYVGGIAGNLIVGSISDSTNNGEVISSSTNSGGIVGGQVANSANNATITNCTNNSSIHGTQYVGGIAGNLIVGSISDSTNSGEISSDSTSCAGIVGIVGKDQSTISNVTITNCINEGNITSQGQAGGIAGGVYPQLTCTGCSNYGNITVFSNKGAGGIIGYIQSNNKDATFSITKCYSDGIITTDNGWAGGIFGYLSSTSLGTMNLTDVLSASKVVDNSATGRVGGFMVGQNGTNAEFNLEKCQQIASISFSGSNYFSSGYVFGNINKNTDSNLAENDKDDGLALSNSTIKLIRAVRKFDCAYDTTIANDILTGINKLRDDEISALDLIVYYGKNNNLDTYYRSALYINNYLQNNGSITLSLNNMVQLHAESSLTTILAIFITVGALASFIIIKKRKSI